MDPHQIHPSIVLEEMEFFLVKAMSGDQRSEMLQWAVRLLTQSKN